MMKLHENKEAFEEIIDAVVAETGYESFQIEKDYYVSMMLKKLNEVSPNIVFKGGTSLSKCYNVIKRFSEDIDLNILFNEKAKNLEKRVFKDNVITSINDLGFKLLNEEDDMPLSRRDFNKYLVGYEKMFSGGEYMIDHIIIETGVFYKVYPYEELDVSNYITNYLMVEQPELVSEYNLEPFNMKVQTIDRTFVDKVFAICDYFEEGTPDRYSRHIYDLHMIWTSDLLNTNELPELVSKVIDIRKPGKNTYSSKTGYKLFDTLNKIIKNDFYKKDYNTNTREFLSEEVEYDFAIKSLKEIMKSGHFPKEIH